MNIKQYKKCPIYVRVYIGKYDFSCFNYF